MSDAIPRDPERLLRLARQDDAGALGELLERYREYLRLLARLQIGTRLQRKVGASDVVQDALIDAHRNFAAFRGTTEAQIVSWLRRILASSLARQARRYSRTRCRDLRLEREMEVGLDHSSRALDRGLVAPQSSPSARAARREQAVLLADALARLPEHYREVIILRHLEGLALAEVARRMDRTVDSVRKIWARALARLRCSFGATHGPA